MDDKDTFAVWVAGSVLRANEEDFEAATLDDLAAGVKTTGDLDAALKEASSDTRRPGDFGLEFIGPLLPVILVEFGRLLWDSYVKSLADEGGKELASATIDKIKAMARGSWSHNASAMPLSEVEARLREAATHAHLTRPQTEKLVTYMLHPEVEHELAGRHA